MTKRILKVQAKDIQRRFLGVPNTIDKPNKTFEIVITTETPVCTWVPDPNAQPDEYGLVDCIEADEILLASGMDFSRTPMMPLLDSHDSYSSIDKILGKVENVRIEGQSIVGTASFVSSREYMLDDLERGFYGQISAGYYVSEYEYVQEPGQKLTAIATKWTLTEASMVAVGADPYASVRSENKFKVSGDVKKRAVQITQKNGVRAMDETLIENAEAAVMAAQAAVNALDAADTSGVDDETMERIKAIRAKFGGRAEDQTDPNANGTDTTNPDDAEMEQVRALAIGLRLTKVFEEARAAGGTAKQIRSKINQAYFSPEHSPLKSNTIAPKNVENERAFSATVHDIYRHRNARGTTAAK